MGFTGGVGYIWVVLEMRVPVKGPPNDYATLAISTAIGTRCPYRHFKNTQSLGNSNSTLV